MVRAFVLRDHIPGGRHIPTITLNVDFLAPPIVGEWLIAEVEHIKTTRSMIVTQALAKVGDRWRHGALKCNLQQCYRKGRGMIDASTFEDVIYEKRGRAAWIIINRPKLYNAFRAQTIEELILGFKLAADDREVSSVVLTGAGDKAFCTGDQSAHEGQRTAAALSDCRLMNCSRSSAIFPSL
ncbi:MAG: enoyl-CoA hydratase-related protein [Sphingomonadaceae bacterium]